MIITWLHSWGHDFIEWHDYSMIVVWLVFDCPLMASNDKCTW